MGDGKVTGKEGPFLFSSARKGEILRTLFAPTGSWTTFHAPGLLPNQANCCLADWLKSTDGKAWMRANGVNP